MRSSIVLFVLMVFSASPAKAEPDIICTLVTDTSTGSVLLEEGDCRSRVTPSSTFKVPLAAMAYDAGVLSDAHNPVLSFQNGDPDWGGANWTRDTDPSGWMRYSVLWYSQRIARTMGTEVLEKYAQNFRYGNADFSGDPGFNNGLERAWVASSLKVSPQEQASFLRSLVVGALPVSAGAMAHARELLERRTIGDWVIHGKTGAAYPRRADRSFDYARGWGWYVGWAESDGQSLVFVRLTQGRKRSQSSPGNLTRDTLLSKWPELAAQLAKE